MASLVDSNAVFRQRAMAIGMKPDFFTLMEDLGVNTHAVMAFAVNYTPGSPDDKPLTEYASAIKGSACSPVELSVFKRLFFESFTLSAAELKGRTERTDDTLVRKLAAPERAIRYEAQKKRISGFVLENEFECSDRLIDLVIQQYDDNRLSLIPWGVCTKKISEIGGLKKEAAMSATADITSDYLLRCAMTRRSLAYDQAQLITFSVFELWHEHLIAMRHLEPPSCYQRTSYQQIIEADKFMHMKLCELTRNGIVPDDAGNKPLDKAIKDSISSWQINMYLQPLPAQGQSQKRNSEAVDSPDLAAPTSKRAAKRAKAKAKAASSSSSSQAVSKGAGKTRRVNMPKGLENMANVDDQGRPICFGFNLNTCKLVVQDGKCSKGRHCCCKPQCFGSHPLQDCKKP